MLRMNSEPRVRWRWNRILPPIIALGVVAALGFIHSAVSDASAPDLDSHNSVVMVSPPKLPPMPIEPYIDKRSPLTARQDLKIIKKTSACLTIGNDTTILCFVRETRSSPKISKRLN